MGLRDALNRISRKIKIEKKKEKEKKTPAKGMREVGKEIEREDYVPRVSQSPASIFFG